MKKRKPVKKKKNVPTKATIVTPTERAPVEEPVILRRKNLLQLIGTASDDQLQELYQQIMGTKWQHGVAELGHVIREVLKGRKFGET